MTKVAPAQFRSTPLLRLVVCGAEMRHYNAGEDDVTKQDPLTKEEQTYSLFGGAVADWRLGPDGAGDGTGMVAKLYWDAQPIEYLLPAVVALLATLFL